MTVILLGPNKEKRTSEKALFFLYTIFRRPTVLYSGSISFVVDTLLNSFLLSSQFVSDSSVN